MIRAERAGIFTVLFSLMLVLGACSALTHYPAAGIDEAQAAPSHPDPTEVVPTQVAELPPTPVPAEISPEEAVMRAVESFYHELIATPGNYLVDHTYRGSEHLAPEFSAAVDAYMENRQLGSGDPFTCAQDRITFMVIDEVTVEGNEARATVSSNLVEHSFQPVLRLADGRWQIADVRCPSLGGLSAIEAEMTPAAEQDHPPAPESTPLPEGLNAYYNDVYGFEFVFLMDWQVEEHEVQVNEPGNPLKLMINFYGDPANPPPVQVTVTRGSWEDFSGVFLFDVVSQEAWSLNGNAGYRIVNSHDHVNYVFENPSDPDLRVVFDAAQGNQEEIVQQMLESFRWVE